MTVCPGNPEGHVWQLIKEEPRFDYVYPRKRRTGLMRKLFGEWKESSPWNAMPYLTAFSRQWACSNCRQVEWETVEVDANVDRYLAARKKYEYDI